MALTIRKCTEKDYPFILKANEENVDFLSPMDEDKLKKFASSAETLMVADIDSTPAAFLIAFREGLSFYDSENYRWFSKNYPKFLYIDRVVIDMPYRGSGIGRALYNAVLSHAKITGVPFVTAEIDTVPYNEASLKFHKCLGFKEVGVQSIRGGTIKVSLQEAEIK